MEDIALFTAGQFGDTTSSSKTNSTVASVNITSASIQNLDYNTSDTPLGNGPQIKDRSDQLPFFWEYQMSLDVQAYGALVIIVAAIIGNSLSIAVLRQKVTSTSIYLTALASVDLSVTLIGQLTRVLPRALTGIDTGKMNPWWCSTWFFLNHSLKTMSGWTLVAVTVERTLVVYLPLRARNICTTFKAKLIVIFIIFFCSALHLHYFWTYGALYETHGNTTVVVAGCTILKNKPEIMPYMMLVRPWQDFVARAAAPFVCLLTCNCLIIGKLAYDHRNRKTMITGGQRHNDDHVTSITAMLLAVSFAHLVCIAPLQIMYLVDKSDPFGWRMDERWKAQVALRWTFAIDIYYANHAINFILYYVSGSEFRRELGLLLSRMPGCSRCVPLFKQSQTPRNCYSSTQSGLSKSTSSEASSLSTSVSIVDVQQNCSIPGAANDVAKSVTTEHGHQCKPISSVTITPTYM